MPGRGGAGNIEAANNAASSQLLASRARAEDQAPQISPLEQAQQHEYAHSGRGGAGNYYSPRVLAETGAFGAAPDAGDDDGDSSNPNSSNSTETKQHQQHSTAPMTGRGGAGNFLVDETTLGANSSIRDDNGSNDADLQRAIERDLEKGLPQAPSPAYVRSRPGIGEGTADTRSDAAALDAAAR